ncbi:hypothetical protein QTP88_025276 [Uroleucon formosanum]
MSNERQLTLDNFMSSTSKKTTNAQSSSIGNNNLEAVENNNINNEQEISQKLGITGTSSSNTVISLISRINDVEPNKARKLKFQHHWLTTYSWLLYSEIKNGAFCKFCVVFGKCGGVENQKLWLIMLSVYHGIHLTPEEVIDELAKKPRKLDLVL